MRSQIIGDPAPLGCRIVVADGIDAAREADPQGIFEAPGLLVVDGIDWQFDFVTLRDGLNPKIRRFNSEATARAPVEPVVARTVEDAAKEIDAVARRLHPGMALDGPRASWRPMTQIDEPLHFDTWIRAEPQLNAFVNIDTEPRVYNASHTFEALCRAYAGRMTKVVRHCRRTGKNLSYRLREHHLKENLPPMRDPPRVRVDMAPGALWFFYPKTVSHEVVYGRGAVSCAWQVAGSRAEMQDQIIARVLGI